MTKQTFNEKDLLDIGFKKEYYEDKEMGYYLCFELFPEERYSDLCFLWEEGLDYVDLHPYPIKVKDFKEAKEFIEVTKKLTK